MFADGKCIGWGSLGSRTIHILLSSESGPERTNLVVDPRNTVYWRMELIPGCYLTMLSYENELMFNIIYHTLNI